MATHDFILPPDFATKAPELSLPDGASEVVLHCCCAPCAGAVLETFYYNKLQPVVYFYNPNIHPQSEYEKRRDELMGLCQQLHFDFVVGDYDVATWLQAVKGHEDEPERSTRCELCFTYRLMQTARFALSQGIGLFTSTLATSRWKSKAQVDAAGMAAMTATGCHYWNYDWRKKGLAERRNHLVKALNFYNQTYCGCVFGRLNADKTRAQHRRASSAS